MRQGVASARAKRWLAPDDARLAALLPMWYGLSALSSAQVTVSREGDGHGRGKGEKPDEEQKQIAGFAWSHDAPAMKADR